MACYRYRGLASFRTSPWDKDEELPADYQRIYRQGNIKLLKKKIMKTELTNSVAVSRTQGRSENRADQQSVSSFFRALSCVELKYTEAIQNMTSVSCLWESGNHCGA